MKFSPKLYFIYILFLVAVSCNKAKIPVGKVCEQKKYNTQDALLNMNDDVMLKRIRAKEKAAKIEELFDDLKRKKGFNGCVLIAQYGKIIYKNSFGYSDIKHKEPLTIQSEFQLASVSKQFTAVAIMMLKDIGVLTFEDKLTKYFPNFPYPDVSIYTLLTHRSGLPNYIYFAEKYIDDYSVTLTNKDIIEMMIKNRPEPYATNDKKFHYCNTNYVILASIVEKITEMPFDVFMKSFVFDRLKMNHTFIYNDFRNPSTKDIVKGYSRGREIGRDYLDGVVGDKGVYSTVEDLYKWDRALYTEKLVKQATLKDAFKPTSHEKKGHKNYGYGWRLYDFDNGTRLIYHGGWWHGFSNLYIRRLEDQSAIIILSNKVNGSIKLVKEKLLETLDMSSDIELNSENEVDVE